MTTDVVVHQGTPQHPLITDQEIDRTWRLAKALAASNFFKDARQAEQAFAKMLFGRDLGLSPTQAMTAINIVEGKPELSANLQASLVRSTPGYDYRVVELTEERCRIEYMRHGELLGESVFTMADAQQAGLAGRGVWQKYPRNMLFARAMSNGVAFHCPEVTGGLRVYSEGEISGDEGTPLEPPVDTVAYGRAPDASDAPTPHAASDIPSDFSASESAPEPVVEGDVVEHIDPAWADRLFEKCKAKLSTIGKLRQALTRAGYESQPSNMTPEAVRLAVLSDLSPEQAALLEAELDAIA